MIEVPLDHQAPNSGLHPPSSKTMIELIYRAPAATTAQVIDTGSAGEVVLVVVLVLVIAGRVYLRFTDETGTVLARAGD